MLKRLLCFVFIFWGVLASAQLCPSLINDLNGASNVPVNTTISWNEVVGVPGYFISIGTTPGGTDIENARNVASATSYTPPLGLPDDTQIYVTITLFFFNSPDIVCDSQSFRTEDVTTPPPCTTLRNPVNTATSVNIATNIRWNYAPSATGYRISIGTSPTANDIEDNRDVGNVLTFNPDMDLPPETQIYVTIVPYNENGTASNCRQESFTTNELAVIPNCTTMLNPANGAMNVPLDTSLEWTEVPDATGYRVNVGLSPFTADIISNSIFFSNTVEFINFEPNRTIFITIVPFNEAGEALGCTQETFSTILGCGPFFDPDTGLLTTLNPEINFPEEVTICLDQLPNVFTTEDTADGFRWYRINEGNDSETLLSETSELAIFEEGRYRYEAYTLNNQFGSIVECPTSQVFTAIASEAPTITSLDFIPQGPTFQITTNVTGEGDYEFALNDSNGPYQDSNVFTNLPLQEYTVYVRDKIGCGIAEATLQNDISADDFPNFFSPNGDTINDFWQFTPPVTNPDIVFENIFIFDRYGTLLAQIEPQSPGWDGTSNGRPLPASDYWFLAIGDENLTIRGHFALLR